MLLIIKIRWKEESGFEYEHACFVALKKFGNSYKVKWVGNIYLAIGLATGIKLVKSEAEKYYSKSTFAYEGDWEFNLDAKVDQHSEQEHCSWGLPDKKHKIQIFCEKNAVGFMFWYNALFKSGDSSGYTVTSVGHKYCWIGGVLEELAKYIDNPLLHSNLFNIEHIDKFPGIKIEEIIDGVEAKYSGKGEFLFETLVSPIDDPTKAVLVFNQEADEKLQIDREMQYSTSSFDVTILVPVSNSKETGHAVTFQRQGGMVELKGDWRDSIGRYLMHPLWFTSSSKWKNSRYQFVEKAAAYILYNAPWQANVLNFKAEKVKKINWILEHPACIGSAFYICSLDEKDINSKFLVVWSHGGQDITQKLRYVGGLGSAEEVQKDYARYISSELAFQETEFTRGIAKYDKTLETVKKVLEIFHDFLEKEYFEKPKEIDITTLLESYNFGRISTPLGVYPDDEQLYCLYGNIINPSKPAYATILIQVKETMHGMKCLSFLTEAELPRSALQAENDLAKFIALYHMRHKS